MLYYTTASATDTVQVKPELSLGGYKSSSPVPNDFLNNIIQETSLHSLEKQTPYYIAIVLKNETGINLTDFTLWFDYPTDNIIKLEVAVVELNSSGYMERVVNSFSKPYSATFYTADGEDNKVSFGDLANLEEIGVWFRISYIKEQITTNKLTATLVQNFGQDIDPFKSISVKIDWREDVYYPGGGLGGDQI